MGLIRKVASASSFGAVKYTSRREAETKERLENARLAKAQRKAAAPAKRVSAQWDEILAAFEAGEVAWDDLSLHQKLSMPMGYQIKCKAAARKNNNA